MKDQEDFINYVSHELRTPLTSLKLYAEMLASDRTLSPAQLDIVNRLIKASDALTVRLKELRQEAEASR